MNLRERIGRSIASFGTNMAIAGQFEGHEKSRRYEDLPRERGSQEDITEARNDREEIMVAARAMCNLFGLGNRILRTYANYVVGDCDVTWQTSNDSWNDAADELWKSKSKLLDVRGREDLSGLARLALISLKRDGDCAFAKVKSQPGFPMLDPIEADRIGPRVLTGGRQDLVGGVQLNGYGRPLSYMVADRTRYGGYDKPRMLPAASMVHVYDSMRFDAVRGLSAFAYGALGRSRALRDLIRAEQTGVAVANKWAMVVKSSGPTLASSLNLTDNEEDATSNGKAGPPIQDLHDGMIFHAQPGEDLAPVQNNRPSQSWQGFVEFLIHDYAISLDLPYEFVWSMSGLNGPAVRLASKQADRTFRHEWRNLCRRFFIPTVAWVTANAIEDGELPPNPEFYKFSVQRPSHPTIDVGRDSAANVAEYEKGWVSGMDICGEQGKNIYTVYEQKARELNYAAELEKKYGLQPGSLVGGAVPVPATPAAPTAPPDDDDEPPRRPLKKGEEDEPS